MGWKTSLLSPCGRNSMYAHQGSNKWFATGLFSTLRKQFASRD
nr:MAG TPA: hypothetical protein [Caudoviricetes sp.]